jgi:hypothetical protein
MLRLHLALTCTTICLALPTVFADNGKQNGGKRSQEVRIVLVASNAFPGAKGYAKFKNRGDEREFEVELEHLKQLFGQRLAVCLAGLRVGDFKINSLGRGELNLNSEARERVPAISSGLKVQVHLNNACNATLVASGRF